jgi:hypothetical protein
MPDAISTSQKPPRSFIAVFTAWQVIVCGSIASMLFLPFRLCALGVVVGTSLSIVACELLDPKTKTIDKTITIVAQLCLALYFTIIMTQPDWGLVAGILVAPAILAYPLRWLRRKRRDE